MAISPHSSSSDQTPNAIEPPGSYAPIRPELTVADMAATSAQIRAFERARIASENESMRPRFTTPATADVRTEMIAPALGNIIREGLPSRSALRVAATSISTIHNGRIALRDAARIFGWNETTSLAATFTSSGFTLTLCGTDDSSSTFMDAQQRWVVPKGLRNNFDLMKGESVLVIAIEAPVTHVCVIPMSNVTRALLEKE